MLKRIISLTKKEFRQFVRDRSSLMIGFLLPIFLILIFGYALSFDVRGAKLAVVMDDNSPKVVDIVISMNLSEYLNLEPVRSYHKAVEQLENREIDGFLHFQSDFTNSLNQGSAAIQLTLHGTEAVRASAISAYVNSALQVYQEKKAEGGAKVELVSRMWFNAANNSTWYLVPGLIVLIMTLVGALLTALVMAREWERGTLEALFVSPVRPVEILISKMIPYFSVGMVGFVMCILAATFLFHVPIQGSLILITLSSMLYMSVALGIGLLISALTKNQFLSSQIALLVSFLPAMMLSGFIFDQRNLPLGIWLVSKFVPATYFMELIKTLFLAGNNWYLFFVDCGIMVLWAAFLLGVSWFATRKRLD